MSDRLRQMLNPDGGMVVSFMGVEGNEAISELRKLILMLSMHGDKVLTDEERIYFYTGTGASSPQVIEGETK